MNQGVGKKVDKTLEATEFRKRETIKHDSISLKAFAIVKGVPWN